jgi:chitin disaccharide deacetylase
MNYLIVNGDDFGLCAPVNLGVVQACQNGILTSASIMANSACFEQACELSRRVPRLAVGVHITLTWGAPVQPAATVSSLVNSKGRFFSKWAQTSRALAGRLSPAHIELEIRSQVLKVMHNGVTVTHLDSHHHLHSLPLIGRLVAKIAAEFKLPVLRTFARPHPLAFSGSHLMQAVWRTGIAATPLAKQAQPECWFFGAEWMGRRDKQSSLMRILDQLGSGCNELMCHPATADIRQALPQDRLDRYAELQALCDPQLRQELLERKIKLISPLQWKELSN